MDARAIASAERVNRCRAPVAANETWVHATYRCSVKDVVQLEEGAYAVSGLRTIPMDCASGAGGGH